MARAPTKQAIANAVLEANLRTYGERAGVRSLRGPSGLYRLLVVAHLMSARIRAPVAEEAAVALFRAGWTTPAKMAAATWAERTTVLNKAGYARYDERTSRQLEQTASALLERYRGDVRRLREEAGRDPKEERAALMSFTGIGAVGADIFCREAQREWDELYPFADERALACARRLGLPDEARALTRYARDRPCFCRLVSGLVRVQLDKAEDEVLAAAS